MSTVRTDLFGRRVIYTDAEAITSENVVEVIDKAARVHSMNRSEIDYLYWYYRGNQPVLQREKVYNQEINNKVMENRAAEIVTFKTGYLMGEPIQYVNRSGDDGISEQINLLNEYVFSEDKAAKDKELAEWFHICGTAYRICLPDPAADEDDAPFEIYTLDPRDTFVVYSTQLGNKPMLGATVIEDSLGTKTYSVYTKDKFYVISSGKIVRENEHVLGDIPIIEYPANSSRIGAFESVLPLLDAISACQSDRIDAADAFIQAMLMLKGVDVESEDLRAMREMGCFQVPVDGDAKYLVQELNQTATQTLKDDLYQSVLTICGMPSQGNGNTSDSSNNGAVILRNGWQGAEARAKDTELIFKKSEKVFLKLLLRIAAAQTSGALSLRLSDIEIRFTRRNYENIQQKAQVLCEMLATGKIHPRLCFEHSGMFADPELAYTMSEEYRKEQEEALVNQMMQADQHSDEDGEENADPAEE